MTEILIGVGAFVLGVIVGVSATYKFIEAAMMHAVKLGNVKFKK